MPTAGPDRVLFDPALGVASDRALGRALAGQAAAFTVLWRGVLNDPWLEGFVPHRVAHEAVLAAAAAGAGYLFGPIIARAGSWIGTVARALGLGVVGGVAARLVSTPLALLDREPSRSASDVVMLALLSGVVFGLSAGVAIVPLALRHRHLRTAPALDFAPRFYLLAAATFAVPYVVVSIMGPSRGTPTLVVAAVLAGLGLRAGPTRLHWLARVGAGAVPGYRLDEVPDDKEIASLPPFVGDAQSARGVLLRAEADGAWAQVARVDPARAAEETRDVARRAAIEGAYLGIYAILACFVPVLILLAGAGH